jgi:adenosylcobyric acid synthase
MITGTMSSAGKSFVTAGLCRVFRQDGFRTAPFKSQNMALNSYITKEGLEMGRAQVMQAEAAGIEPDVRMNPILLKPTSDQGSQVIVGGEIYGTMRAQEYYRHKEALIPEILKAYQSLSEEYDIIVLEGAGSPAEINLQSVDLVNMGMAALSDSPVILVGDIDRGGVFAALYGTIMLLPEADRRRICGIVINKFRGDIEILKPGLTMIESLTGVPVLGVLPYVPLDLDEEDSLSERFRRRTTCTASMLDLAVIRLPRISNFTDFQPLERIEQVSLRYVTRVQELGNPDLILLPGTKSTMADLKWLRQTGLEAAVHKCHARGSLIFGICGGMQMLGETIADPLCTEDGGSLRGMGLLPIRTVFHTQKRRTRISGTVCGASGVISALCTQPVHGYEIHMGTTTTSSQDAAAVSPFLQLETGETDGFCSRDGTVCGTYLHGIFDTSEFTTQLLEILQARKGVDSSVRATAPDLAAYKEAQYDRLAHIIRTHLDLPKIYRILEDWSAK